MSRSSASSPRSTQMIVIAYAGVVLLAVGLILAIATWTGLLPTNSTIGSSMAGHGAALIVGANQLNRPGSEMPRNEQATPVSAAALTQDEKRYAIATSYLAQLAILSGNFLDAIKVFNMAHLEELSDSSDVRKRYFDRDAAAAITVCRDSCMIQVLGDELDKFAGPIESVVTATGGTARIVKSNGTYAGALDKDGLRFSVQVGLDERWEKPILFVSLTRC